MTTQIQAKLWSYATQLRHDGVDDADYVEQLSCLLFLKMVNESDVAVPLPQGFGWTYLMPLSGSELTAAYENTIQRLRSESGPLGAIFGGAQNRIESASTLKSIMNDLDRINWSSLDVDVKGALFEFLIEQTASQSKKGAGQYFTPRLLIRSMVKLMKPDPRASKDFALMDPACGTGGFLLEAWEWAKSQTAGGAVDHGTAERLRSRTYFGQDIGPRPRRLAHMNMYLRNLQPNISGGNSLTDAPGQRRYDVILTNPPFGNQGARGVPNRDDFTVRTSNKQLNFIQHILTILKDGGRAAVVVPDNVLFADHASLVFEVLMEQCNVHTVQRLPRGIFAAYAPGTQTNVVYLTKGLPTQHTWIYDNRTNIPSVTKRLRPLTAAHFTEFEACFGDDPDGNAPRNETDSASGRWRRFSIDEVREHGYKLDTFRWIKDESIEDPNDLPAPSELIADAVSEIRLSLEHLAGLEAMLAFEEAEV